ncbi:MAG: hypothetical protein WCZ18_00350 [Ottowia sp.]|nr:hypothetical protein [Ottowia sp.]
MATRIQPDAAHLRSRAASTHGRCHHQVQRATVDNVQGEYSRNRALVHVNQLQPKRPVANIKRGAWPLTASMA